MLESEELKRIRNEVDEAGSGLYEQALEYKAHGDEDKYKLARMTNSHLLSAYLELMNAIDALEVLEGMEWQTKLENTYLASSSESMSAG